MSSEFMAVLERVRVAYGKPMKLSSAFRDATHPVEARKGDRAGKGDHCRGVAVDVLAASSISEFQIPVLEKAQRFGVTDCETKGQFFFSGASQCS